MRWRGMSLPPIPLLAAPSGTVSGKGSAMSGPLIVPLNHGCHLSQGVCHPELAVSLGYRVPKYLWEETPSGSPLPLLPRLSSLQE